MEPPVQKERRSTGMMIGGIVIASVGALGFIAGSALISAGGTQSTSMCIPDVPCNPAVEDHSLQTAGVVSLISGGVLLAVGIPLLLYGAKKVPVRELPEKAESPAARLVPELRVGPLGGALRWQL